jgi:integrase
MEACFEKWRPRRSHLIPMVMLAIHTGLRKSELLRLRRSEVDFDQNEIRRQTSKNKRRRAVRMNSVVRDLLTEILAAHDHEYVFTKPRTGRPYTDVKKGWRAVLAEIGIEDLHWHDLRHTATTRMGEAGIDPFTIAALLGHSDLRLTGRYTHATDENRRRAVAVLNDYAGKCPGNVKSLSRNEAKQALTA